MGESNIVLRALEPEDLDVLYEWENEKSIWQISNTITPFSKYILRKYIDNSHLDIFQARQLRLMIDAKQKDGKILTIGTIDLFDFEPQHLRAGIGILIGNKGERGKGYARSALTELINYAFVHLKLVQLYCNIEKDNLASMNLFKGQGFEVVGVKKMWNKKPKGFSDEVLLQLINPIYQKSSGN